MNFDSNRSSHNNFIDAIEKRTPFKNPFIQITASGQLCISMPKNAALISIALYLNGSNKNTTFEYHSCIGIFRGFFLLRSDLKFRQPQINRDENKARTHNERWMFVVCISHCFYQCVIESDSQYHLHGIWHTKMFRKEGKNFNMLMNYKW